MSLESAIYKSIENKYNIELQDSSKILNEDLSTDIADAKISAGEVEDMIDSNELPVEKTNEEAMDEFYELLKQDIPPTKAKAIVLGKDNDMNESLEGCEKKMSETKKRGWDPDEHLQKVVEYYKNWAGFDKDQVITEDMLKHEDWRLKRVSSLKSTPVSKIRAELLKQKDSE